MKQPKHIRYKDNKDLKSLLCLLINCMPVRPAPQILSSKDEETKFSNN